MIISSIIKGIYSSVFHSLNKPASSGYPYTSLLFIRSIRQSIQGHRYDAPSIRCGRLVPHTHFSIRRCPSSASGPSPKCKRRVQRWCSFVAQKPEGLASASTRIKYLLRRRVLHIPPQLYHRRIILPVAPGLSEYHYHGRLHTHQVCTSSSEVISSANLLKYLL